MSLNPNNRNRDGIQKQQVASGLVCPRFLKTPAILLLWPSFVLEPLSSGRHDLASWKRGNSVFCDNPTTEVKNTHQCFSCSLSVGDAAPQTRRVFPVFSEDNNRHGHKSQQECPDKSGRTARMEIRRQNDNEKFPPSNYNQNRFTRTCSNHALDTPKAERANPARPPPPENGLHEQ